MGKNSDTPGVLVRGLAGHRNGGQARCSSDIACLAGGTAVAQARARPCAISQPAAVAASIARAASSDEA
eukprot:356375-Chlamydomonas_euryale.AAC.7